MKKFFCVLIIIIVLFNINEIESNAESINAVNHDSIVPYDLNKVKFDEIDNLVEKILSKSGTPGASIMVCSGTQSKFLSYGTADNELKNIVNEDTLFELGSTSKAFTGLAILQLESQGKLSLGDSVTKYIPWFRVHFNGTYEGKAVDEDVKLTLRNVLYQTTGIPFKTVGDIPEGTSDNMLEETVRGLIGTELDFYPGEKHQYATINYDILGYIIQIVSGQMYESYIKDNILKPLGLKHTYLFQDEAKATGLLASGHKRTFFQTKVYEAPRYRGNTPAGYIFSNARDMERWMKIQLGLIDIPSEFKSIINKSHIGDTSVSAQEYYYAAGWQSHIKGRDIRHGGSNPNYSSYVIMLPKEKLGIFILANQNTNAVEYLADNILNMIQEKNIVTYVNDSIKTFDIIFSIVIIVSIVIILIFSVALIIALIELIQKKRRRVKLKGAKVAGLLLATPLMTFFVFCIYYMPNILLQRLPWESVNVWGSSTIMIGCILGCIAFFVFMVYVLFSFNVPKENVKGYLCLIPLSIINGICSALIIFTINESFNRNLDYSKELLVYFLFAIFFFAYTIKLLQGRLIFIAHEMAYEKRMTMIDKIMSSSYQVIEDIGGERIYSGLNNDCTALAKIPGIIVNFFANILTLVFCLSYLFTKSIWTFVASLSIIVINGIIGFMTSRIAEKYWEENRDIQDVYFSQMSDLVKGFKELVLNKWRKYGFWKDMKKYSRLSAELNKTANIKFLNFGIYNTLMYNLVFGVVVFVFPILILGLDVNQLRENLFIIFFMIGPFGALAAAIPELTQINVNLRRINNLIEDLDEVVTGNESIEQEEFAPYPKEVSINYKDIIYKYVKKEKDGETEVEFTLGPINLDLGSGEMLFITGGNGSGKSTLGRLITGLYAPCEGEVFVNGEKAELNDLNELFSSIYSDFNLFKKLYGIDYEKRKDEVKWFLEKMGIDDKIEINQDGEFKTIELSTGQRKRLAFAVSCLEDKPMLIFDEWAAEQDPEFRYYFYNELLPMLKEKGKGIVVITHDDRYFDCADRLIKLEFGKIISDYRPKNM